MIELFARKIDAITLPQNAVLTPLPLDEDISSLSAIMLNDDYYNLMLSGRRSIDGISVLGAEYLIAFKAKAWLDLSQRKAEGVHVNDKDLKKHKNDVFRLYAIVDPQARITVSDAVGTDLRDFFNAMDHESVNLKALGIEGVTLADILASLTTIFSL